MATSRSNYSTSLHYWIATIVIVFASFKMVAAFHPNLLNTARKNVNPTMISFSQSKHAEQSTIFYKSRNDNNEYGDDLPSRNYEEFFDNQRRMVWTKTLTQVASIMVGISALVSLGRPVYANNNQRSRTTGYTVQKTEQEWKQVLSPMQYYILREGGTERPKYSILEKEKRSGVFKCAGCNTPLFESKDKFNSGTGWPSFARGLPGVEVEEINPLLAGLSGAELRCKTCGGHLGDVFNDGYIFVGTEAAVTGQRYCIDGAALLFYPVDDESNVVRGDIKQTVSLPIILDPPVINSRD